MSDKPYKYIPKAIDLDLYDKLMSEIELKRDKISVTYAIEPIYERRDTAWQTDTDIAANYSNKIMNAVPFTPTVKMVKDLVEKIVGVQFDSALIFHYKDNKDSMGFHHDDVGVSKGTDIAGVTFGATRRLAIRNNKTKEKEFFDVGNGDIFYMFGNCQETHKHAILLPDADHPSSGPRLAITFRKMLV
ncbi:2OG-Fe(II) oxygenase [Tupanvirus deep ocean]|uniref:2OG-Fe(II) oxygenase n=2 Tax=Tupanvirus TaxID=2094720 RepID=A0AC62A8D8_9VIRU|nr:2OG-Fe(II) oxygenase [Tupanvirus deep ocean]QKU34007.1 2OG-Fe(II) oxygenase [Tupanvirus deep ocean]